MSEGLQGSARHGSPIVVSRNRLGMSRVLLGVGAPYLSPSPFVALCQGVRESRVLPCAPTPRSCLRPAVAAFINPILDWDHDDPENRLKWKTQQPTLRWYDPP